MKFAFSTNAYRKFSFSQAVASIADAGYAGVEIMCDTPHAWPDELSRADINNIKFDMEDKGLEISNLNAFMMCAVQDFHHPSWIEPDESFRQVRIEYTKKCIHLAAELGAHTISTEPGGPLDGMSRDEALDVFIDGLKQVMPPAEEKGISVLIEPEPGLLIQTSDEYLEFADRFAHPNMGLNFDVGHFFCVEEDPVQTVLKLKEHTRHYHLEDIPANREHRHILPGEGAIDIKKVLQTIEKTGYKGFVTLELYPYLDDPDLTAKKAREYLEKVCGYEQHG